MSEGPNPVPENPRRAAMRDRIARRRERGGLTPPTWSEAMPRQPRAVQLATYRNLKRYGKAHAARPTRIRAGKR